MLNKDSLEAINIRWPHIKRLDLTWPFSYIEDRVKLWSSFAEAVEIKVGSGSLKDQ